MSFSAPPLEPGDRHVLFVYDREHLEMSVICVDVGNDGSFDTCMNLGAASEPPASTDEVRSEVFKGDLITYTVRFTNTANTTLQTPAEIYAMVPTHTVLVSGSVQCDVPSPISCSVDYALTQTRLITAAYGAGLPAGESMRVSFVVSVTGSMGDEIEMASSAQTALIPPVHTYTLRHYVVNRPPALPTSPSPPDGARQVTVTHGLCWVGGDLDGDVVTYMVHYRSLGGVWETVVTTATCVTPTRWLTGTVYEWYVEADDGIDVVSGPHWRFTTFNNPPYTPLCISPTHGARDVPLGVPIVWWGGDPDPNQTVHYTLTLLGEGVLPLVVSGLAVTTYLPSLAAHTPYVWLLTATDGISEVAFTSPCRFTTANRAPLLFAFSPPSGTSDVPVTQTLHWQGSDADGDPLVFTAAFGTAFPLPRVVSGTTATSFNPGRLLTGTVYYWWVACSDGISVVESGLMVFTTTATPAPNRPPLPPLPLFPPVGSTGVPTDAGLQWLGGDPDLDPITYTVILRRLYPHAVVSSYTTASPVFTPTGGLTPGTTYEWQIIATDGLSTTVGPWWRFSTVNRPPYVTDPTPSVGETYVPITQVLAWLGGDPDMGGNTLVFSVALGVNSPPPFRATTAVTTYDPGQLLTGTTYVWAITVSDHISTVSGGVWHFTTVPTWFNDHPPYTPTHYFPPDGAEDVPTGQHFTWIGGDPDKDEVRYIVFLWNLVTGELLTGTVEIDGYQGDTVVVDYDPGGLAPHTAYTWYVVAQDPYTTVRGAVAAFTTANRVATCASPSPPDGARQVPPHQPLRWDCEDPDGDVLTTTLTIRGSDGSYVVVTTTQLVYTPTHLVTATRYLWEVWLTDGLSRAHGGPWSFVTVNHPPLPPTDVVPGNGDVDVPITTTIGWSGGDPDGQLVTYTIAFGPYSPPPVVVPATTSLSYDPGPLLPHTTYYVVITATDGLTFSVTSWHFTTANRPPFVPGHPSPADGAVGVPLTTTLEWQGGDEDETEPVVTYTLSFWRGGLLVDRQVLTVPLYNPAYRLNVDVVYTWQVVATDGFSTTVGPVWVFTTTDVPQPNLPPVAPYAPTPTHLQAEVPLTQTWSWQCRDPNKDPLSYTVIITTAEGEVRVRTTRPQYDPGRMRVNTVYTWQVVASDGVSERWGPVWTFTTTAVPQPNLAPCVPKPLYPPNGAEGVSDFLTLRWEGCDPNKDPVTYTLALWTAWGTPLVRVTTDQVYTIPGRLEAGRRYDWQITATDGLSETVGGVWSFTTTSEPSPNRCPAEAVPLAPLPGSTVSGTVVLRWWSQDPDGDPLNYYLSFSAYPPPSDEPLPPIIPLTTTTSYTVGTLREGAQYYWRVFVSDGACWIEGDLWSFTVASAEPLLRVSPPALTFSSFVGQSPAAQSLTVNNVGGGELPWQAKVVSGTALASRLYVTPPFGMAPSTLTVSLSTAGLGEGTYTGALVIGGQEGVSVPPQTIPVTLAVSLGRLYLPVVLRGASLMCDSGEGEPNDLPPGTPILLGRSYCGDMQGDQVGTYADNFYFTMSETRTVEVKLQGVGSAEGSNNYDLVLSKGSGADWVRIGESRNEGLDESIRLTLGPLPPSDDKYVVSLFYASGDGTARYVLRVTTAWSR